MKEIENLRAEIDRIDASLVELLKERMKCVRRVGEIKQKQDSPLGARERSAGETCRTQSRSLTGGGSPEHLSSDHQLRLSP